jgi:hypothetical protein
MCAATMRAMLLSLLLALAAGAAAKTPPYGVFATINGKKLKAPNVAGANDACVFGFHQDDGGIVFTAIECRGRKVRRVPRKSFQELVMACAAINGQNVPPYDVACIGAAYSEVRSRRGVPFQQKIWTASADFELGPGGTVIFNGSVRMTVDSFDGSVVRGRFSGVFDMPQDGVTPAAAAISGEGTFAFPVRPVQ